MRSYEACGFSMMRTNVPDALVAIGIASYGLEHELSCVHRLPSVRSRGPSGLNFVLQAKVTGRF